MPVKRRPTHAKRVEDSGLKPGRAVAWLDRLKEGCHNTESGLLQAGDSAVVILIFHRGSAFDVVYKCINFMSALCHKYIVHQKSDIMTGIETIMFVSNWNSTRNTYCITL